MPVFVSFSVPVVRWRGDSAVCALWHRPRLSAGLGLRERFAFRHPQLTEASTPNKGGVRRPL